MRLLTTVAFCVVASTASAQTRDTDSLVYKEQLEGVFFQDWFTRDTKVFAAGIRTATVIGAGNSGDFEGELYVDCPTPAASRWLSVNGDLDLGASDVPRAAIVAIREALCALD